MFASYRHLKKSNKKRAAIEEAIYYWNDTGGDIDVFSKKLRSKGWQFLGSGAYKQCFCKNGIVIKYAGYSYGDAARREVEREVEQWKYSPKSFRDKHLVKTYAFKNGLLIQERVHRKCENQYNECAQLRALMDKRGDLYDALQNHGHDKAGNVRFFDWVWRRTWGLVETTEKVTLKNRNWRTIK